MIHDNPIKGRRKPSAVILVLAGCAILNVLGACTPTTSGSKAEQSSNANLASLTVEPGTLTPEFSQGITEYTVALGYQSASIVATATVANPKATLSGDAGKTIALPYGQTILTLTVTAEDGTVKTTHITVTRSSPETRQVIFNKNATDATGSMANLSIAEGTTATLTANAFYRTGYTFAGWATSPLGAVVYANSASYTMGANGLTLYAVWTKLISSNANLASLSVAPGSLTPPFSPGITEYTVQLGYQQTSIVATAAVADAAATLSGDAGKTIALPYGQTILTLTVTAEDGTVKTTHITVTRSSPETRQVIFNKNATDATGSMANLSIAEGTTATLTPNAFYRTGYTFAGWATSPLGAVVYANSASYTMGANGLTLYAVWTKLISSNANLASLSVAPGSITPSFSPATTEYTVQLGYQQTSIVATAAVADAAATLSGDAGKTIALPYGQTILTLTVTAEDGTVKTTHITVTRSSPETRQVIFNKNATDATGSMANLSIVEGTTATLTANAFYRTGYTFAGWATSPLGAVVYANSASYSMGASGTTLYAVWLANGTVNATVTPSGSGVIAFSGEVVIEKGTNLIITVDTAGLGTFAWYLDGTLITGANSNVLTLETDSLKAGMYYVMVVARNSANVRYSAGLSVKITN